MPNGAYDFAGTTYELYDGSNKVATFVMKSDGTTNTVYEGRRGKIYTLKETVAGKGFELDTKTYTITVDSNGNISINNGAEVDNNGKAFIYKDAFYKFILLLKKTRIISCQEYERFDQKRSSEKNRYYQYDTDKQQPQSALLFVIKIKCLSPIDLPLFLLSLFTDKC